MSAGLLQLGKKPVAAKAGPVLLQSGFRPFFLLAAVVAVVAVSAWILVLRGVWAPRGALLGVDLHVHEMIFGFAAAVIAGFLLTAVKNWTGRAPAPPLLLGVLVALFVLGRVAVAAEAAGAPRGIAAVELLFLPTLAVALARPVWLARDRRNVGVVLVVVALAGVDGATHAAAWGGHGTLALSMRSAALLVPCVLLAVIGGRVIPLFTRNVVLEHGAAVRGPNLADTVALVAAPLVALLAALAPFFAVAQVVEPWVAMAAGLAMLARMVGWASLATLRTPIVWILHVGFACLGAGLVLRGLSLLAPGVLAPSVAMHVLAVGALATLCLGMMTRVSLGHTGRMLELPRGVAGAYHSLLTALVLRVGAAWVPALLDAAALFFALAFLIFFVRYAPLLLRPRADGAPG